MNAEKRNYNIDLLRIISAVAVVVIHVSAKKFDAAPVSSSQFIAFDLYDSLSRWAVPVFVMISGMFMLDESKVFSIKKLYTKNILRIATAFAFWSAAYTVYNRMFEKKGLAETAKEFIFGQNFMWFLFMIAALYAFSPFLRKITESKTASRYFIAVFTVLIIALPTLIRFTNGGYFDEVSKISDEQTHLHLILGIDGILYSGYFVLGHYLSKTELSRKTRTAIYALGVLSFFATAGLTYFYSLKMGKPDYRFFNYLNFNVLLESTAVFVLLSNIKLNPGEKTKKLILNLSKYSFGVYLIHPLFIDILNRHGLSTSSFNPFVSVIALALIVYFVSLIISAIINQMPLLKKYIV